MTTVLMPVPKQQYFNSTNQRFLAGGKLYTYAAGSTTPKATYTDSAGTTPQTNPIILNARGEPDNPIYWDGAYKVVLKDANDVTIYTVDNYKSDPFGVVAFIASLAASAGSSLIGFLQSGAGAVARTLQSKLRDTVSVKDFGAVMDGVTDDNVALTAAITYCKSAGKSLFIPGGTLVTSQPIYPSGLHIYGEGEMDSVLSYTGTGIFLRGDATTVLGVADTAIYDAVIERIKLNGPGSGVAGTIGIDGDMYRSIVRQFTVSNFEIGMQVRGAIVEVSRGRVENCVHGVVVRPYKAGAPSTTITLSGIAVFFCTGNAFWVDHEYNAAGVWPGSWPQCNSYGGAASIVFRDTVAQNSAVGYKVNRGSPVIFDNAYSEQNTKTYDITSSVNPTFIRFYSYADTNPGTFDWTDIPDQGQGPTALEDFGLRASRMFVGGKNAKGGSYNDFTTLANRGIKGYYSGGQAILKDPDATTTDLLWHGTLAIPKKWVWSLQSSDSRIQLDSYTDAGAFSKNIISVDQLTGNVIVGNNVPSTTFKLCVNGAIGPLFDNAYDLGSASFRMRTIYAGTGAINTSDGREKQQIQNIEAAALRAAKRIKFAQFKFNDAVERKGDGARWHFGVIAQQVKEAFEAEGLDAFKYGLLCYDEWDAEPAVLAEDGTVEREARPAGNRYGVRYDELLALKLAALDTPAS